MVSNKDTRLNIGQWVSHIWRQSLPWQRFLRLPGFQLAGILPLLGAATVVSNPTGQQLIGLIIFAFNWHVFAFMFNDVIDLPADKLNPQRQSYPLVRGDVKRHHALIFSLLQIPVGFAVTTWLQGSALVYITAAISFAAVGAYDIWGKVNRFPPLTDFIQGISWAGLIVYGAGIVSHTLSPLTWIMATIVLLFITVLNGIHASLRDLKADYLGGKFTASMLLGGKPNDDDTLFIPTRLKVYMYAFVFLISGLTLYPLFNNLVRYQGWVLGVVIVLEIVLQGLCVWGSYLMVEQKRYSTRTSAYIYWGGTTTGWCVLLLPGMSWLSALALIGVFFTPLLISEHFHEEEGLWWWLLLRERFAKAGE